MSCNRGVPRTSFEDQLRSLNALWQLAWIAGIIVLSIVAIKAFSVVGIIFMAPLWRATWRALLATPGESQR